MHTSKDVLSLRQFWKRSTDGMMCNQDRMNRCGNQAGLWMTQWTFPPPLPFPMASSHAPAHLQSKGKFTADTVFFKLIFMLITGLSSSWQMKRWQLIIHLCKCRDIYNPLKQHLSWFTFNCMKYHFPAHANVNKAPSVIQTSIVLFLFRLSSFLDPAFTCCTLGTDMGIISPEIHQCKNSLV